MYFAGFLFPIFWQSVYMLYLIHRYKDSVRITTLLRTQLRIQLATYLSCTSLELHRLMLWYPCFHTPVTSGPCSYSWHEPVNRNYKIYSEKCTDVTHMYIYERTGLRQDCKEEFRELGFRTQAVCLQ